MKIAIQPDKFKTESYSEKWAYYLDRKGIDVKWIDLYLPNALEQLKDCDALMWRSTHSPDHKQIAKKVMYAIEAYLGIPVFPNNNTYWHYDEKITQDYIFRALGIETPKTWIFWNRDRAIEWASQTHYPKVFKFSSGASSESVRVINSAKEAIELTENMFNSGLYAGEIAKQGQINSYSWIFNWQEFLSRTKKAAKLVFLGEYPNPQKGWNWRKEKNYIYFLEFIPNNTHDTRVVIIGNRIWGFVRFNRPGDFRASGSGNFDLDPSKVDKKYLKLAYEISSKLKCQSMAYDFLSQNGRPIVTEMSYTFVDWVVAKCPGYWRPDLTWVEGNVWPEEAQVEDFIEYVRNFKER